MKKRILSTLLCLCMLLATMVTLTPAASAANVYQTGSVGDCNWELNGTVLTVSPKGSTRNATWEGVDLFVNNKRHYITKVIINEGVTCIGENAFMHEEQLTKVTLPESITSIGTYAFWGTKIKSIAIPKNVTSIGNRAFESIAALEEIKVDPFNQYYSSLDGVLFNKDKTALIKYPEGKSDYSFTVPDSVITLKEMSFQFVRYLYDLNLPDTIQYMEDSVFGSSHYFTNPAYYDNGMYYIDNYLVYVDRELEEVVVRPGTRMISGTAIAFCDKLERIVLNEDLVALGDYSISYCQSLKSIYIPQSLQLIQKSVFYNCPSLKYFYYSGSEEDAKKISYKEYGNYSLPTGRWTFNSCPQGPEHAWVDGNVIKAATCTEEGQGERVCEKCGRTEKGVLSKAPHTFVETFNQAPTCTATGKIVDTCSACGLTEETYPAALGHSFSEWATVTTVTCTEDGLNRRTCSTCGLAEEETVPALGHSFSEWTLEAEATCTEDGLNRRTCSACFLIEENYPAAFGHSFDEWTTATEPTCTEDGLNTRTCATCELVEEETVPAFGHSFSEWATEIEATCTEDGKIVRVCSACGLTEEEPIAALGHSFGEFSVTTAPSLLKTGEQTALCSRCDETKTEELPKKVLFVDWDSETIPVVCVAGVILFLAAGALGVIIGKKKKK